MKSAGCVEGKMPKGGLVYSVSSILYKDIGCEISRWNRLWIDRTLSHAVGKTVFRLRREHKPKSAGEVNIFRGLLLNPGFKLSEGSIHRVLLALKGTLPRFRYQGLVASSLLGQAFEGSNQRSLWSRSAPS